MGVVWLNFEVTLPDLLAESDRLGVWNFSKGIENRERCMPGGRLLVASSLSHPVLVGRYVDETSWHFCRGVGDVGGGSRFPAFFPTVNLPRTHVKTITVQESKNHNSS